MTTDESTALIDRALAALADEAVPVRERIASGVEAACTLVPWADVPNLHMRELASLYYEALGIHGMPHPPLASFELADQLAYVSDYFAGVWAARIKVFLEALRDHGPIARKPEPLRLVRGEG